MIVYYSDKAGRSIPAPGRGALTVAKEVPSKYPLPILSVAYRSRQLTFRRNQISQWLMHEHSQLCEEADFRKSEGEAVDNEYLSSRVADIEEAKRQEKDALAMYGMLEGASFTPVWGLSRDDITSRLSHSLATSMSEPSTLSAIRQACCLRRNLLKRSCRYGEGCV